MDNINTLNQEALYQRKLRLLSYLNYGYQLSEEEKAELAAINKRLKKLSPAFTDGGTYSFSEVAAILPPFKSKLTDKNNPKSVFEQEQKYQDFTMNILKIVGDNYTLYKYFNSSYYTLPKDVKLEVLSEEKEKVSSNNIYDLMAAKSKTTFKGSFNLTLYVPAKITITVERVFTLDTTLNMRDIVSFM